MSWSLGFVCFDGVFHEPRDEIVPFLVVTMSAGAHVRYCDLKLPPSLPR